MIATTYVVMIGGYVESSTTTSPAGLKRHQLHCRFILPDNRRRFGKIRAIVWNIKVLNRLRCAQMRGMGMPSCGTASRV